MLGTFLFGECLFGQLGALVSGERLFERILLTSNIIEEISLPSLIDLGPQLLSSLVVIEVELTSIVLTAAESEHGPI